MNDLLPKVAVRYKTLIFFVIWIFNYIKYNKLFLF